MPGARTSSMASIRRVSDRSSGGGACFATTAAGTLSAPWPEYDGPCAGSAEAKNSSDRPSTRQRIR